MAHDVDRDRTDRHLVPTDLARRQSWIAAVAAAQVVEKTLSLAMLGVFVGKVLDIPWYTTFTTAAPLLALSMAVAALVYPITLVLAPAVALAVGIPMGFAIYAFLLRSPFSKTVTSS